MCTSIVVNTRGVQFRLFHFKIPRQMDDSDNFSAQVIERVHTNNNNDDSQTDYNENAIPQIRVYQNHLRRNLICFWIIGLCGGIGASILSSASFDVIKRLEGGSV